MFKIISILHDNYIFYFFQQTMTEDTDRSELIFAACKINIPITEPTPTGPVPTEPGPTEPTPTETPTSFSATIAGMAAIQSGTNGLLFIKDDNTNYKITRDSLTGEKNIPKNIKGRFLQKKNTSALVSISFFYLYI